MGTDKRAQKPDGTRGRLLQSQTEKEKTVPTPPQNIDEEWGLGSPNCERVRGVDYSK